MAHQAHNISYAKYEENFNKIIEEELKGSNHKITFKNAPILSHEFIQVLKEFALTIQTQIKSAKPYKEKEYAMLMGNDDDLQHIGTANFFFWHLCNAINKGEPRLFATILHYMRKKGIEMSDYNFYYPGYGQAYMGGLCQVFDSFLRAYLLINTLVNAGLQCNKFWYFFRGTSKVNKISLNFMDAFNFSCNTISDEFHEKYKHIIEKIPPAYLRWWSPGEFEQINMGEVGWLKHRLEKTNVSFEELRELSKEMFRLMYTTYAILTIQEQNERIVNETIENILEQVV